VSIDRIEDRFDRKIAELGIRVRDMDQLKVREDVFDEITLLSLYRLVHRGWITAIGGSISTGKEANIFLVTGTRPHLRSRFTGSGLPISMQ